MIGPHVFGDDRLGVWVINSVNLTGKLKHFLPRANAVFPVTDIFLPEQATGAHKDLAVAAGYFAHTYAIPSGRTPKAFAQQAVAAHAKRGALELNIELPLDSMLKSFIADTVKQVRALRPNLRLRINVAPYKGYVLPVELFSADPNLFLIVQAYFGNMDGRLSEADVLEDVLNFGVPREKVKVMYGVMAGNPREIALPNPAYKVLSRGSLYSDDLMLDAGLLPA